MKLYMNPVSTTSLPVVLFCAEAGISYEPVVIDLMTGEHKKDAFLAINPKGQVPTLDDDGFILTESSAILKYLADKIGSPAYPKDLQKRARVNERMDWVNTEVYRDLGYNLTYPQLLPHHVRGSDAAQMGTLEWGKMKAEHSLAVLDKYALGSNEYICGDELTIADYFAAQIIHVGSLVGANFSKFPNLNRWLERMRALPNWKKVNEAYDGFAASVSGKSFVTVGA